MLQADGLRKPLHPMEHPGGLCVGPMVTLGAGKKEVLPKSVFASSLGCLWCALSLVVLPEGFLDVAVCLKLWTQKGKNSAKTC